MRPCCRRCRDGKVVSRLRLGHTPPRVSRQVYRDDVGQWADVKYDDGDEERMKPIKRIKARDCCPRLPEITRDCLRLPIKRIKALWRGRLEEEERGAARDHPRLLEVRRSKTRRRTRRRRRRRKGGRRRRRRARSQCRSRQPKCSSADPWDVNQGVSSSHPRSGRVSENTRA